LLLANGSREVSLGPKSVAQEHAGRHEQRRAIQEASGQFFDLGVLFVAPISASPANGRAASGRLSIVLSFVSSARNCGSKSMNASNF